MNTIFLKLYKVENEAPEIGSNFNIKFTGGAFQESQPCFHFIVNPGALIETTRCVKIYDVATLPYNSAFNIALSSQYLPEQSFPVTISYAPEAEEDEVQVELAPPGFPPTSKVKLFFKKYARQKVESINYYEELRQIEICLKLLLMQKPSASEDPVAESTLQLLKTKLEELIQKLNVIGNVYGYTSLRYLSEGLSFTANFSNFLNHLYKFKNKFKCHKNFFHLIQFQGAYNDFILQYNTLKNYLNGIGINPCGNTYADVWGDLDDNFRSMIDCLCKMLELDGQVGSSIQTVFNVLKSKIDLIATQLNNLSSTQQNQAQVPSSPNYSSIDSHEHFSAGSTYCEKLKNIANLLEWVNRNRMYLIDSPPNSLDNAIATISNELNAIKAVFMELDFMIPEYCKKTSENYKWKNTVIQSSYIYVQACGSNQSDSYSEGVHLRWSLLKEIGDKHIPKGNLANMGETYYADFGYSKNDDFVKIERIAYNDYAKIVLDFSNKAPVIIEKNAKEDIYIWRYAISSLTSTTNKGFSNEVVVRFLNNNLYDAAKLTINPITNSFDFLKAYDGVVEISVLNKLLFKWKISCNNSSNQIGTLKYEAINLPDTENERSKRITIRKEISDTVFSEIAVGENIYSLRCRFENSCFIDSIELETYNDFLTTRDNDDWQDIGNFGLTNDTNTAFGRLETSGNDIHGNWPRFHNDNFVNIDSYEERWNDGLLNAVEKYLDLSKTNCAATEITDSDEVSDLSKMPINYLDVLQINALDFHQARMLGLGHIDQITNNDKYVYVARYSTNPFLISNRAIDLQDHYFMSLPTNKEDLRIPLTPELDNPSFGLENLDECSKDRIHDENGYALYDDSRIINIKRKQFEYEIPYEPFFNNTQEFNIAELALPIFYGIKYKPKNGNYVVPDLVNSDEYKDLNGSVSPIEINETVPLIESNLKIYTHIETNQGEYQYEVYGINWFSRATQKSNAIEINTTFTAKNFLKPPSAIHAHYIQKEENLLFTTQTEQDELNSRIQGNANADNCQTRLTFLWNHFQNISYPGANKVEVFYKNSEPLVVEGIIDSVTSLGNGLYDVKSKKYNLVSSYQNNEINPVLDQSVFDKFIGSYLMSQDGKFNVVQIQTATLGPIFRVKAEKSFGKIKNGESNDFTSVCKPIIPVKNTIFTVIENLANESNWNQLDKTIQIVKHSNHSEIINGISREIGGIYGVVSLTHDIDIVGNESPIEGLFKIQYTTETLANHPQNANGVKWYKGNLRVPDTTGEIHDLEVWHIESQNPLIVWAYDPSYSANEYIFANNPNVNFFPGYKVYLEPENDNNFNSANILPSNNEPKKSNLIALRSVDDTGTNALKSTLSPPSIFLGFNIKEPLTLNQPIGAGFVTRPDINGKSSYSIDLRIDDEPFAVQYYRSTEFMLLTAIYDSDKIEEIYESIETIEVPQFENNRFQDLANCIFDEDLDVNNKIQFKEYDGYRLPNIFKESIEEAEGDLMNNIRRAINNTFVGLTLEPIVLELVKTDNNKRTSSDEPVTKDSKGQELSKTDPAYNIYPFAVKFTENNEDYLRFTDYSVDGSTFDKYYYIVAEITREQKIGERSLALGPIKTINAAPAYEPYIKKYEVVLANPYLDVKSGIRFYINPYLEIENVEKIAIYRTLDESKTENVNLMDLACICNFSPAVNFIVDEFENLDYAPYEDDIYYRLVALRKIKNEFDEIEYIPSKASEIINTKVVDNVNPPAPSLTKIIGITNPNPPSVENIKLEWEETCYKGKYTLYKMSEVGFWQIVKQFNFTETLEYEYPYLNKTDADGDTIYHRFKVVAENRSGLLSIEENVLTI